MALIEAGHGFFNTNPFEWPWSWARLVQYVKRVRSVYERAAYSKEPKTSVPPKWMWFDDNELDKWFEEKRKG